MNLTISNVDKSMINHDQIIKNHVSSALIARKLSTCLTPTESIYNNSIDNSGKSQLSPLKNNKEITHKIPHITSPQQSKIYDKYYQINDQETKLSEKKYKINNTVNQIDDSINQTNDQQNQINNQTPFIYKDNINHQTPLINDNKKYFQSKMNFENMGMQSMDDQKLQIKVIDEQIEGMQKQIETETEIDGDKEIEKETKKETDKDPNINEMTMPTMTEIYNQLLCDNLCHLIDFIYQNKNKYPYNSPITRTNIILQMLSFGKTQITFELSSKVAKDLEELRNNYPYIKQFENSQIAKKNLRNSLKLLKKYTIIDDSISLNFPDSTNHESNSLQDFDIHSGLSTLNVSSKLRIDPYDVKNQGCQLM